jgi:hypothetical protein
MDVPILLSTALALLALAGLPLLALVWSWRADAAPAREAYDAVSRWE